MSRQELFDKLIKQIDRHGKEPMSSLSEEVQETIQQSLPPQYALQDVSRELCRKEDFGNPTRLRALRASLMLGSGPQHIDDEADEPAKRQICNFVARTMAPFLGHPKAEDDEDEDDSELVQKIERTRILERCKVMAEDGTAILKLASSDWGLYLSDQALYTLISFADETQSWTTPAVATAAREVIRQEIAKGNQVHQIVGKVLNYLRELFSKSRPHTITASGRKAEYEAEIDVHAGLDIETPQGKPWKYTDLRSIPLIAWAVDESNTDIVSSQWPHFIPVLLTLADDSDASLRSQGLRILLRFLGKVPSQILVGTGLTRVFEDAIFPTLHLLPNLTPEEDSLQLLGPAFRALLALARHQPSPGEKERLLDKIMRDGIFAGFFHARTHVKIVEVLVQQTVPVVQALSLCAVKHLKDLIPMFREVMTDPFALSYPGTLTATIEALQATLISCWPRIGGTPWQDEITKMLVVCGLNVREDGKAPKGMEAQLVKTAAMLAAVMKATDVDVSAKFGPLVGKEPQLAELFALPANM